MYQDDSFHTLSVAGQFGLVLMSILLSLAFIWAARRLSRHYNLISKITIAVVLFYLFVWLSPQVYYSYYWLLMDNLPVQSVIKPPPNPITIIELIFFQGRETLSAHGKGLLSLSMIIAAIFPYRVAPKVSR